MFRYAADGLWRDASGVRGLAITVRRSWHSMHCWRSTCCPARSNAGEASRALAGLIQPGLDQQRLDVPTILFGNRAGSSPGLP